MRITMLAALCIALVASTASATPNSDWKAVSKALSGIYSRAGGSVMERIDRCKIKPVKQDSWVEILTADKPEYGAKKGDTIIMVKMDFPDVPAEGSAPARPGMKGVVGLWVVSPQKVSGISRWADQLLFKPAPLAANFGMKC